MSPRRTALLLALLSVRCEAFVFAPRPRRHRSPAIARLRGRGADGDESADGNSFTDYVGAELSAALREQLAVIAPNAVQAQSLPLAAAGRDVLIVAQTGSGKTLSFLLPILRRLRATAAEPREEEREGRRESQPEALVIAPTPELAAQHWAVADKLWRALPGHGEALQPLETALLCATPEAVLARVARGAAAAAGLRRLGLARLRIVAVDEVDAVLCGEEFDEAIPEAAAALLARLLPRSDDPPDGPQERRPRPRPQFLMTTAHLNQQHAAALGRVFPAAQTVRQAGGDGVLVPTLRQAFHYFAGDDARKTAKLLDILRQAALDDPRLGPAGDGTTLVFCADAEGVAAVRARLAAAADADAREGADDAMAALSPTALHGGMRAAARAAALAAFRAGTSRCLVTTDAVARGLDVPSVRHVILYDMPASTQGYVHRAGRTARAGDVGLVTCLVRGGSGFGCGGAGSYKHLHALQDAPALEFVAPPSTQTSGAPVTSKSPSLETLDPSSGGDSRSADDGGAPAADGAMTAAALRHTSTVALVPPEEAWPPLQATRAALRDGGLYRWPPHVNLLYPFLPPRHFEEAVRALAPALAAAATTLRKDVENAAPSESVAVAPSTSGSSLLPPSSLSLASSASPFSITLDELAVFGGRSRGVLYCCPSDPQDVATLQTIQAALQSALPFCHHQQRKTNGGDSNSSSVSNRGGNERRGENSGSSNANADANASHGVFTPHLTLAHFTSRREAEEARSALLESESWQPVTFDVAEAVCLMHRDGGGGQFAKAAELPLGDAPRIFGQLQERQISSSSSSSSKVAYGSGERSGKDSGEDNGEAITTLTTTTTKEWVWTGAKRFESMPLVEEAWIRKARKEQHRQRARGRKGGRGRRPRRTPEERAAIAARTPEEIEDIRAQRRQKRERLEAAAAISAVTAGMSESPGSESASDQGVSSTSHGNPFSGRKGFPEIGVCMCEHQDNSAGGGKS